VTETKLGNGTVSKIPFSEKVRTHPNPKGRAKPPLRPRQDPRGKARRGRGRGRGQKVPILLDHSGRRVKKSRRARRTGESLARAMRLQGILKIHSLLLPERVAGEENQEAAVEYDLDD
jgi:hypothetical protein